MARFDVYRGPLPGELWLDCQSDFLGHLTHRFVVPLAQPHAAPSLADRWLNPKLVVDELTYVMLTQFSSAVPVRDLGERLGNLQADADAIITALDTLTGTA